MKTTIDLDTKKLTSLMKLAGLKSKKAAVDYAISCANRVERLRVLLDRPLADEAYAGAMDPSYDVLAVRELDKPKGGSHVDG